MTAATDDLDSLFICCVLNVDGEHNYLNKKKTLFFF